MVLTCVGRFGAGICRLRQYRLVLPGVGIQLRSGEISRSIGALAPSSKARTGGQKFPIKRHGLIRNYLAIADLPVDMRDSERYRHYAAECVRLARKADDPAEKDLLLQMAEHWRAMAVRAAGEEPDEPIE